MPSHVSNSTAKSLRAIAKPYDVLADVFKRGNRKRLIEEVDAGYNIWSEDNNLGLVLQVLDASRRFAIIKLGSVFAALSIHEVASRTSPDPSDYAETEAYIMTLISSGQLKATLSNPSSKSSGQSILRFTANEATPTSPAQEAEFQRDLAKQMLRLKDLVAQVQEADKRFEMGKEYIEWKKKTRAKEEELAKVQNGGIDNVTDDMMEDEDMMGDV